MNGAELEALFAVLRVARAINLSLGDGPPGANNCVALHWEQRCDLRHTINDFDRVSRGDRAFRLSRA